MRRSIVAAVGLFLAVELLFAGFLWQAFRHEGDQVLKLLRSELEDGVRRAAESKVEVIEAMLLQAVDVPAVKALLAEALPPAGAQVGASRVAAQSHVGAPPGAPAGSGLEVAATLPAGAAAAPAADPETGEARSRRARGRLYRLLLPSFEILRARHVRSLQLVLPDGTSFLRFQRPDLYGDPIARERPLLARVIATGRPERAFENSRVYPGMHYAYPLMLHGRLVGVADFGLSFDAIRAVLQRTASYRGRGCQLMLRRDLLEAVGHPSVRSLFLPARLHPDFVLEDPEAAPDDREAIRPPPDWVASVDRALAVRPAVQRAIAAGESFAGHVCIGFGDCWAASLLPIADSAGRVAGFASAYVPDPAYVTRRDRLLLVFGLGSGLLLLAGALGGRWLGSRERLQTIGESMAEGLYVTDRQGHIVYVNRAACALLGRTAAELKGRNAHVAFHMDGDGHLPAADRCPVRLASERGEVFRDDNELFRRRDGSLLRVSLVSSPLRQAGEIRGSIVLFRDVGDEYATRERLKRADAAFRNLAEGVMVTDTAGRVLAVNPAFTHITGYTEGEVLGRNPSLLSSGRHDRAFYADLWQTVAATDAWEGEIWNRRKTGEIYPEWLKITTIRGELGEPIGYVGVFSDISDLRAKEERLKSLAYQDQLTGLYNRHAFLEIFEHALRRAASRDGKLALLILDFDRFKRINDTFGHVSGDALIAEAARRIRSSLRPEDQAARLGGDEMAILLDEVERETAPARFAQELLGRLREPMTLGGRPVYLTASVGIAMYPQDGGDAVTLIKNADAAMYLAKQQGRDGWRYFSSATAREAEQRFELESELRHALAYGELRLHYQPQVDLEQGRLVGLEALLRWEHPRSGLILPGHFLGVAREAGLMPQITEWTLREAARQCAYWRSEGVPIGAIGVNLDALCLQPVELELLLAKIVLECGIDPGDLELEILETAMHSGEAENGLWGRLVDAGFGLAIDDFGTGESSLARLKRLPVRTLKIDRSFVRDIETDDNDRSIVRTVIAMTDTLGKRALAEGVESEAQLRFLIDAGCHAVQGYYFSPPIPPERIPALIACGELAAKLDALGRAATRPQTSADDRAEQAKRSRPDREKA